MGSMDTGGYETYEIKMPVCGNPVVGDCVIDGNTLWLDGTRIAIKGLHAPKINGRCKAERILARISAERLSELLSAGTFQTAPEGMGLRARALSTVNISSGDLRVIMIGEGLADSQPDTPWCVDSETGSAAINEPRADEPWRERFNARGEFPKDAFKAVYFSRNGLFPKVVREYSDAIAVNYIRREFHNIKANSFAAYWATALVFDKPTMKTISVSQSGNSKIRINGDVVYEPKQSTSEFVYEFPAGEHTFEVEYVNTWHTVGVNVTLQDEVSSVTRSELSDIISEASFENPHLLYAGLYTSSNRDNSVKLNLPKTDNPLVLWLDSYETTNWIAPPESDVALAVIASSSPGTTIRGGNIGQIIHVDKYLGVRSFDRKCKCINGRLYCEYKRDLADASDLLTEATGLNLKAYHVAYKGGETDFVAYDEDVLERLRQKRTDDLALERSCGT